MKSLSISIWGLNPRPSTYETQSINFRSALHLIRCPLKLHTCMEKSEKWDFENNECQKTVSRSD